MPSVYNYRRVYEYLKKINNHRTYYEVNNNFWNRNKKFRKKNQK